MKRLMMAVAATVAWCAVAEVPTQAEFTADVNKLAGFWWDYSEKTTVKKSVAAAVRQHAVSIYQKGLDDGTISGLNKKQAEQRVASGASAAVVAAMSTDTPKQRIPKGLAHRWSFNGDFTDSVGCADARPGNNVKLEKWPVFVE